MKLCKLKNSKNQKKHTKILTTIQLNQKITHMENLQYNPVAFDKKYLFDKGRVCLSRSSFFVTKKFPKNKNYSKFR